MATDNRVLRSVDQLSLAAWFGGSLMGATSLPRAAAVGEREIEAEGEGWSAWQPVQSLAIAAQLVSGIGLTVVNRKRLVAQRGVATTSVLRTVLTGAAVVATAGAAATGQQLQERLQRRTAGREELYRLESRTRRWQWAVPALTGALVVLDAVMGEQQRPQEVKRGVLARLTPGS
jgi:hypothetical protein